MHKNHFLEGLGYLALFALVIWVTYKTKRKLYFGFVTQGPNGLKKAYSQLEVEFHHWGSTDASADGNDFYLGFYGIIKSSQTIPKDVLESFFDQVEYDSTSDGKILVVVKKKKIFVGTEGFRSFLEKFDKTMQDLDKDENLA